MRILYQKSDILGTNGSNRGKQKKNIVFQSTSTMVDASFNCFRHFVGLQNALKKNTARD
ncbi:MAG TPA: hypothetical protein GX746_10440 [Bacteroidales bacterium]|nr:hypothetical protein [Bacteroidales bacterium]